ncbi:MAG: hypothetical protein HYU02_03355 [Thaumarchaeota archaeon]|nr:hypothetical protein [Nitrososphaerota archaeon]
MDAQSKIRIIDTLSFVVAIIAFVGIGYILFTDNFQFFFNWKLIVWVGIISAISFILVRKRQNIFAETL